MTKLLIISHTPHYRRNHEIVGWGPTVREIDYLSELFGAIVHVAPLHSDAAPASALAYQSNRVSLRPVKPSGGKRLRDKLGILTQVPHYLNVIRQELNQVDAVHVRCPANISLLSLLLLALSQSPSKRWVKYAGNWKPERNDPYSYALQRWALQHRIHRGVVTVNGRWADQPSHIHSFPNPSLDNSDIECGKKAANSKHLRSPIRLLHVGRVEEAKGTGRTLRIARALRKLGVEFQLDIIGDGPQRMSFEQWSHKQQLVNMVKFHGWQLRSTLNQFYTEAHFILLPSSAAEGWPKVLSEAMAFGVVPLASTVASIPQILSEAEAGRAIPAEQTDNFVSAIQSYMRNPQQWRQESQAGLRTAKQFTYQYYQEKVGVLFRDGLSTQL